MQDMRSALRQTLRRSLRPLSDADRLAVAWPVVCGPGLAGKAAVLDFAGGQLSVEVQHAGWLDTFAMMQHQLAGDLARVSGVAVRAIHFTVKR